MHNEGSETINLEAAGDSYFPTYHKDKGVYYGSYSRRLSRRIATNISTISDAKYTALSIGLSNFGSIYQLDLAGLIASDKGYGGSVVVTLNIVGASIVSTVKHTHSQHVHNDKALIYSNPLDMIQESLTNYNIAATYSFMNNSIVLSYDFLNFNCDCKPSEYEFGANYSRPLFNTMSFNSTISSSYTLNRSGYSLLVGINIQVTGKSIDHSSSLLNEKPLSSDINKQSLNYTIKYKFNQDLSVAATANVRREPTPEVQKFNKQLESSYLADLAYNKWNVQAQILANHMPDHSYNYFYNLSASSNWGCAYSFGNGFAFTKNNTYNSAVFLRINAPEDGASFNITFDDDESYIIKANKNYNFGLSPYKFHKIQVISQGDDSFYKIEGIPDKVFLYPGNILPVTLSAKEFFVLMTVLVDPNGEPIRNATIKLGGEFDNNSDEFGEVQIDVSHGDKIKVTYQDDSKTCHFKVPEEKADGGILMIDQIECS